MPSVEPAAVTKRGLALLPPERRREIATLGGKANDHRPEFTPGAARDAGRKGGLASARKRKTQQHLPT